MAREAAFAREFLRHDARREMCVVIGLDPHLRPRQAGANELGEFLGVHAGGYYMASAGRAPRGALRGAPPARASRSGHTLAGRAPYNAVHGNRLHLSGWPRQAMQT